MNPTIEINRQTIRDNWGESVLEVIDRQQTSHIAFRAFINTYCTAMGGDCGDMLLTGLRKLYPEVWDAIPNDMGEFAFVCILCTLRLLGINDKED